MLNLVRRLVVSGLAIVCSVSFIGCASVSSETPEVLAKRVEDTYRSIQSAEYEFLGNGYLIGEIDPALIAANQQTIVAPVLTTKDRLGFAAYKDGQQTPFRMAYVSEHMVSEYDRGRSTQYELNASAGIRDPKFMGSDDCFIASCFVFEFGRPELRVVESIRDGTRDFAEENRLFTCEDKYVYVVRRVREFEGENPPVDNWKRVDVRHIDRQSNLIVFKGNTQLEADGRGMVRDLHFKFAHVSKEIPASFGERLAEFEGSIKALTFDYVDPDTLDAEKAEYFAKMQLEYELAMQAKQKENEKHTEVQTVKEENTPSEPVQQGG